jgi:hypothetical protein
VRAPLSRLRGVRFPVAVILGAIVVVGLVLRLRHNDYGLPYSYVADEDTHFTVHAVGMFADDANPNYFRNPSAFTYLLHGLLRLPLGGLGPLPDLGQGAPVRLFLADPTPFFQTGRSLAALLCMAGVVAVYLVGRRLWGTREGLVAAAALSFAFLPVAYSRLALTDVGTFLPVAVAVFAAVRAYETGARRHYLLAGAATGLAIGFKYTTGLLFLVVVAAGAMAVWRRRGAWRATLASLALAGVAGAATFFVTTPFFFADLAASIDQLRDQAGIIGGMAKFGQTQRSGFLFYLDTLGWGFGWAALAAALAGGVFELRRDRARGVLLLLFPVVFFLYLGGQSRYFARYLIAAYPVLALLCGVGVVRAVDLLVARPAVRSRLARPAVRATLVAVAALAVLAQPLAADVRTMTLLGREHTLNSAREYLVRNHPPGTPVEFPQGATQTDRVVPLGYHFGRDGRQDFPKDFGRTVKSLEPALLDRFRQRGFCLVMTTSIDRGKARAAGSRRALAYYERLRREGDVVFSADPYGPGEGPVPFDHDLSYLYHSPAYDRPGPEVTIHRLRDCRPGSGRPAERRPFPASAKR